MAPPEEVDKRKAAREVIDILGEIATLLVWIYKTLVESNIDSNPEHWSGPPTIVVLRIAHREWRQSRSACRTLLRPRIASN